MALYWREKSLSLSNEQNGIQGTFFVFEPITSKAWNWDRLQLKYNIAYTHPLPRKRERPWIGKNVCKAKKVVKHVQDNPYYHYSSQLCLALQSTGALSSYFTFPFLKDPNEGSRGIGKFHAESELACTQQCDRDNSCYKALFYQAMGALRIKRKKYVSVKLRKRKRRKTRIWAMIKVRNVVKILVSYYTI